MTKKVILKIGFVLFFLLGVSSFSFAQLKRADKHFDNGEFSEAIIYYKKVLKKDPSNKEATQNLAFSYRKLKDYKNAEIFYAKATALNPAESSNHLYYGQSLKNNNKLKDAKNQFEKFVEKNPSSFIGKLMIQSCGDIRDWEVEEKEFEVRAIENINTKDADFCPLVYKEGIVFVSERGIDLVNANHSGMANKPYLSLYYAKKEKQYKKPKRFSNQLSSFYHDGPVTISDSGNVLYFTRADKRENGKRYINRLQIFSAKLDGKKWKNILPFEHNNPNYSVAHPWLSKDGTELFFASDMPNGFGGMDIYRCTKEGENWSKPINLGEGVNTSENEVFPYFRKGILYFSSEGHSGYGGLDVFIAKKEEQYKKSINLRAPLNSSKDDFGIYYTDDENGYFSSDREGGVGGDDIYGFAWHPIASKSQITGVLEYDKLGASGTTLNLLDEEDFIIESVVTDEFGKFKFDKLDLSKDYILAIDSDDDSFLEKAKVYLTNSKGEKVILAQKSSKGKYKFQALPYEYYDELELLDDTDDNILTAEVFGQVFTKLPGDYSEGMEVWLVDDSGNIIGRSKTDKKGFFSFEKLSEDEQYLFMLAEDDPNINMMILNKDGTVLNATKRLIDGKYRYSTLNSDESVLALMSEDDDSVSFVGEDSLFTIDIFGQIYKKLPGDFSGIKEIWVVDDEGNILKRTNSDAKGFFSFDKLSEEEQYLFMLAEDDESIKMNVVNEEKKYLAEATRLIDAKYKYNRLGTGEEGLDLISEVDESKVDIKEAETKEVETKIVKEVETKVVKEVETKVIKEVETKVVKEVETKVLQTNIFTDSKIAFEYKSFKLLKSSEKGLNKLIEELKNNKELGLVVNAHTDAIGGPSYNLKLGQKRADEVVRYIVSKGVSKNRVKSKSYGLTKPIAPNSFPDGSDNPEGRSKNRRVEFDVFKLK